mgnify:CR=1 FL=1
MKKTLLTLCLAFATLLAGAKTISPEQALSAALSHESGLKRAPSAVHYTLAKTFDDNRGEAAVYFFAGTGDAFLVTPADDCVTQTVLAYGVQDAANMPANMTAWLEGYARQIEWLRANPEAASQPRRAKVEHSPITPICKTQWGQDEPYNNECPLMNDGSRSVTGCVATAMAQIMKVHQWPVHGTGQKTYSWFVDKEKYTDSFDYENTTFDWANMLDSYAGDYTDAQAKAVATLMHACGVAADMSYSSSSSGTMEYYAAAGLIDHLCYNPALIVEYRNWYSTSQWDNMIYNELAAGQPVLYCGVTSENSGHAFVCDGYSSNGFYHFNWGWNGVSDGYFILSMLDPEEQGTGGGAPKDAYNFNQSAIIGMKPAAVGTPKDLTPLIAVESIFAPEEYSYSRTSSVKVGLTGGFYNMGMGTINYDLALGTKKADGTEQQIELVKNQEMEMMVGYSRLDIPSSFFPVGEYDATLLYRKSGTTDWKQIMARYGDPKAYHFNVTDNQISISDAKYAEPLAADITCAIDTIIPTTPDDKEQYIVGHEYTFDITALSTAVTKANIAVVLCQPDGTTTNVYATSPVQKVNFDSPYKEEKFTIKITIPADLGFCNANFAVATVDEYNRMEQVLTTKTVRVNKYYIEMDADLTSIVPTDPNDGDKFYSGHSYTFNIDVTCNGVASFEFADIICASDGEPIAGGKPFKADFDKEETETKVLSNTYTLPEDYTGPAYYMLAKNVSGEYSIVATKTFNVLKPAGIDTVSADDNAAVEYFTLQGVKVTNPTPGTLVIRRQGTKVEKLLVK